MASRSKGFWGCLAGGCLLLVLLAFAGAVVAWLYYFRGAQNPRSAPPEAAVEQPLDDLQPDEVRLPDEEAPTAEAPEESGQPLIPQGPPVPFTPARMQAAIDALGEWAAPREAPARLEALARRLDFAAGYELSAYCGVALAVGARIRAGDPGTVQQEYARIYPAEVVAVIARPENLEKIGRLVPSE
jgi:hypothetical protein